MNRTPRISAIAAIGRNRELGRGGQLLWRIADDLRRVKELTMGHPLIMGRKTHESIGKPLPGRDNIIITRNTSYGASGCIVTTSLEEAIAVAKEKDTEEIFIFGGAEIYAQALPHVDRLYLTIIAAEDPEADTFFPDYRAFSKVVKKERRDQGGLVFEWVTLERA